MSDIINPCTESFVDSVIYRGQSMELIITFTHGYTSITPDNQCLQISQNVRNNLNIEIDLSEHLDDL